jgi:hypothetical protein
MKDIKKASMFLVKMAFKYRERGEVCGISFSDRHEARQRQPAKPFVKTVTAFK